MKKTLGSILISLDENKKSSEISELFLFEVFYFFTKLFITSQIPANKKGMLSHCPMSNVIEVSNSTCGFLMNSINILEPKTTMRNIPNMNPGRFSAMFCL
jgi:hypothetical protein